MSIQPVDRPETGQPAGRARTRTSSASITTQAAPGGLPGLKGKEVPYDKAPPPRGSNFEQLKQLALLDARTHNFAEAWQAGYAGEGSVVAVLDGGTDWATPT